MSAGKKFKELVKTSKPLTIVGAVNAYSALQATKIGHKALYLSKWRGKRELWLA